MLGKIFNKKEAGAKLNNPVVVSMPWGDETLTLETGRFAKQATASVMATMGQTMVLVSVVAESKAAEGFDYFPMSVDYQEKFAAAGKIPGSRNRREGQLSTDEILTSRLIDRPIRPLFPETFKNKLQITATCFSYDKKNSPDVIAMIGASAALAISGVPFMGPIGAVRVGYDNGEYILNPAVKTINDLEMDLVVAGTRDGVLMVESEIGELDEKITLGAIKFGFDAFQPIIKLIDELKEKAGKPAWEIATVSDEYKTIEKDFEQFLGDMEIALAISDKMERYAAKDEIKARAMERLPELFGDDYATHKNAAADAIDALAGRVMRGNILAGKPRIDGRDNKTIRPIETEVGILPRCHGSALFTRGETQSIVSMTLGGGADALPLESINGKTEMEFFLNYNFPGFSVGEAKMLRGPSRREHGHGALALRSLRPMMPSKAEFDYTIRIVSDILESNGSSSMATVCGGTLAMLAGGVPMLRPVAGIAMGLIKEGDDWAVLSDILGDEDHLGDMDFKVAGTDKGITSLQMDLKITSVNFDIMEKALAQAKDGRLHILGEMNKTIKKPAAMSEFAPQVHTMKINPDKIREVIGKGGSVIKALTASTNTSIDLSDDGTVKIAYVDMDDLNNVLDQIKAICAEPEVGDIYEGVVSGMKDFGLFVKIMNGTFESLVHISEITGERLAKIEDAKLAEGDKVFVKYLGVDKRGKTRLSMINIDQKTGEESKKK